MTYANRADVRCVRVGLSVSEADDLIVQGIAMKNHMEKTAMWRELALAYVREMQARGAGVLGAAPSANADMADGATASGEKRAANA